MRSATPSVNPIRLNNVYVFIPNRRRILGWNQKISRIKIFPSKLDAKSRHCFNIFFNFLCKFLIYLFLNYTKMCTF